VLTLFDPLGPYTPSLAEYVFQFNLLLAAVNDINIYSIETVNEAEESAPNSTTPRTVAEELNQSAPTAIPATESDLELVMALTEPSFGPKGSPDVAGDGRANKTQDTFRPTICPYKAAEVAIDVLRDSPFSN